MNKEEYIKRRGEVAYEKMLQQSRDWKLQHPKEISVANKKWREANPNKVLALNQELYRKGGKRYQKQLKYQHTGLQGERNMIRMKHARQYLTIKQATPNSVFHHEWIPGTAEYKGVALVEAEAHRHGIIDVIQILEGEITIFTEKEIAEQGAQYDI
ncbi:hypothetical protein KAW18_12565 [candidate division WOR-3 bacterium]|nr:hypothetical protein [candidate division WOR-3 bacterium]